MQPITSASNSQQEWPVLNPVYLTQEKLADFNRDIISKKVIKADDEIPQSKPIVRTKGPSLFEPVINLYGRITSEMDAHSTKLAFESKAEKASRDFLDDMAPGSKTDAATAVSRFETSMQTISARMDSYKRSSLSSGITNEITATLEKMITERCKQTGSQGNSVSVVKVIAALTLANVNVKTHPDSLSHIAFQRIATKAVEISRLRLLANLKDQAKQITAELFRAAEPGSKSNINDASKHFDKNIRVISKQRKHFELTDVDFAEEINDSIHEATSSIYYADEKNDNKADWNAKKSKLTEACPRPKSDEFPKDINSASALLQCQLKWMNGKDFSDRIENCIKKAFPQRYEVLAVEGSVALLEENSTAKQLIEKLKRSLIENCSENNESEIAKKIQKNRTQFTKLLMAGDEKVYSLRRNLNHLKPDVNSYLESNKTELDLAVCGMIHDHLSNVLKKGLLILN